MLTNKRIFYFVLISIFCLGLFLRLFNLNNFPVGFHIDEASLGYNGYSISLTGKDDNGTKFPLYIDMFGDNRPAGYHYLTIIPIKMFGLTEFATRFPGAIFGALTIFAFYFLVYTIFENKKISLVAAILLAIAPWHIVLSRASAEAIVALFFILAGFGLTFHGFKKGEKRWVFSGVLFLSISFFFYHAPRLFVPLLFLVFLGLLFLIRKSYKINIWASLVGSALFLAIVTAFLILLIPGGTGRFSQVNIFNSFETNFQLQQQIKEDTVANDNFLFSRIVHNKITNLGYIFANNYLEYFSGEFLFTKGGLPAWYNVPRMGLLYLLELPFLLIGLFALIKSKNTFHKIPLVWLLVAPVVAAITYDDIPNINRAVVMFPMFHIIASAGLLHASEKVSERKKVFLYMGFFALLFLNSVYFLHQYYVNAKTSKPWYRNNGFPQMMGQVKKVYDQYDVIVMSKYQGGIYPLVLFYMQFDPREYQKAGSPKNKDYGGFGKFFFVPQDCPSIHVRNKSLDNKKILYVDKGDCPFEKSIEYKKYDYVTRGDNTNAFRIIYEQHAKE